MSKMSSINHFGRRKQSRESPISFVQIDGLVILKIIKHCHEEGSGAGEVQGVLLGLVVDNWLEITNCFPFPRNSEEDETDEMEYQCVMMRHLRNVNVDHLHVGWYQTNPYGSQISKLETIDSQYMYQSAIEESVVIFYDPIRTSRGFLSVKAYRLTNVAMKLCKEGEFTADTLRTNHMSFDKFFEEIPVVIKNSHLINALLCELDSEMPVDCGKQLLDMGGFGVLEKTMQSQMKCVEEVSKHSNHLRQQTAKQQHVSKENAMRAQRGEPPLNEEEVNKILKPLAPLQRLESLLNYSQTLNYCQQSAAYSTQNISKLFMAKALQSNTSTQDK
ncbi:unnamed protein product [Medioppia subpectinata]|uniref:Eukaryotic translation initiation factor 3 subunit H n=1 Tax=Medioppia subpectinata TaxID=1979941 RepID=A0A7R9KSQ2_9ACAR|nr:unnamed protein product [Medioppia subpectinata]CAG2109167.1 unnamed protein product [Medioppia subpectinata]